MPVDGVFVGHEGGKLRGVLAQGGIRATHGRGEVQAGGIGHVAEKAVMEPSAFPLGGKTHGTGHGKGRTRRRFVLVGQKGGENGPGLIRAGRGRTHAGAAGRQHDQGGQQRPAAMSHTAAHRRASSFFATASGVSEPSSRALP